MVASAGATLPSSSLETTGQHSCSRQQQQQQQQHQTPAPQPITSMEAKRNQALIQRVARNDQAEVGVIFIDEFSDFDFNTLLASMRRNTAIEIIQIMRPWRPKRRRSLRDLYRLLRVARTLPKLTWFEISGFRDDEVDHVLPKFLHNHPTLQIVEVYLSQGTLSSMMLNELATVPRLHQLDLILCKEPSSLAPLLRIKTLKHLNIFDSANDNFTLSHELSMELVSAFRNTERDTESNTANATNNNTITTDLQTLFLLPAISPTASQELIEVLTHNTTLQSLQFSVHNQKKLSSDFTDDLCMRTARLLQSNKTLSNFSIHAGLRAGKLARNALLQALEYNYTIQELFVVNNDDHDEDEDEDGNDSCSDGCRDHDEDASSAFTAASGSTMQHEADHSDMDSTVYTTSTDMEIDVDDVANSSNTNFRQQQEFYLGLNRMGRGDLLGNARATNEDWVHRMALHSQDVDCLHYFLRHNPSLCQI